MKTIRRVARSLGLLVHLGWGMGLVAWYLGMCRLDANSARFRQVVRHWQRRSCAILGLRPQVFGQPPREGVMLVSNHVSWLDIPVLAAVVNPAFLSKAEIRRWPIVGLLAEKAGTLFIERGRHGQADTAVQALASRLASGRSVLFFPEGTTTDGTRVRRFHGRLLAAAIRTEVEVQPVALCYRGESGVDTRLAFTERQGAFSVMWEVMGRREPVVVDVHFLESLDPGQTRSELARHSQQAIARTVENCNSGVEK